MALETRGNRKFFYLSQRRGGRVKKVYVAGGIAAQLAAEQHAELQRERKLLMVQQKANLAHLSALERLVKEAHIQVEMVARLHLCAAGFHHTAGGEWRRRRC